MTTARLKYRNYVPWGWIAIEFCNVEFFGDNADLFRRKWHDIEYAKYDKCKAKMNALKEELDANEKQRKSISQELKELQQAAPWWQIWETDKERALKMQLSEIDADITKIEINMSVINSDKFYDVQTIINKAESFLEENGFVLRNTDTAGNECVTHTDIWELVL